MSRWPPIRAALYRGEYHPPTGCYRVMLREKGKAIMGAVALPDAAPWFAGCRWSDAEISEFRQKAIARARTALARQLTTLRRRIRGLA